MKLTLIIIAIVLIILFLIYIRNKRQWKWYTPEDSTPKEQCPCCDYITLSERGNHLICIICFWEDDGLDINRPDARSGPNVGMNLREARRNFNEYGACNQAMVKNIISTKKRENYKRIIRVLPDE